MSYVQADVDVMNQSLRRVGAEAIVISDANSPTSKPAKVVTSYYDNTIKEVLRLLPWNSAVARASVTGVADTTTNYAKVFSLASLFPYPLWKASTAYSVGQMVANTAGKWYVCIVAGTSHAATEITGTTPETVIIDNTVKWMYLGACPSNQLIRTLDINGDDSIPYKIEGSNLFCNETSPIKLRFIRSLSPVFTDSIFNESVVSRLASKICFALSGDAQVAQALYQEFAMNLAIAKQLCVSEDKVDVVDIMELYKQSAQLAVSRNKVEG